VTPNSSRQFLSYKRFVFVWIERFSILSSSVFFFVFLTASILRRYVAFETQHTKESSTKSLSSSTLEREVVIIDKSKSSSSGLWSIPTPHIASCRFQPIPSTSLQHLPFHR
jgi:hypothetical protein